MTESKNGSLAAEAAPLLLRSLRLQNFLSFGPDTPALALGPLNLLIGANGSGKSNLIEAICLLRSSSVSLADTIRQGGGVAEWIWKGNPQGIAHIEAVVTSHVPHQPLRHVLEFGSERHRFEIGDERIEYEAFPLGQGVPVWLYKYQRGKPLVSRNGQPQGLNSGTFEADSSILAQRKDPEQYPEITYLGRQYSGIRAYREWAFGRNTIFRVPQRADMRNDRLEEDFSNLGLFLNRMRRSPDAKNEILRYLHDLYDGADDFDTIIEGGSVQVFFTEGRFSIPATRLSDGTLRYLCLLAILCDPNPPPLICIEEPELGLHPDILPKIADLLVSASRRTQLIVTTHSDILVDAMTERPEAVVVCEKHEGQTQMQRLSAADLGVWLEKYRLGQLWMRGDLGGTRW
jgi:predicted ATPase